MTVEFLPLTFNDLQWLETGVFQHRFTKYSTNMFQHVGTNFLMPFFLFWFENPRNHSGTNFYPCRYPSAKFSTQCLGSFGYLDTQLTVCSNNLTHSPFIDGLNYPLTVTHIFDGFVSCRSSRPASVNTVGVLFNFFKKLEFTRCSLLELNILTATSTDNDDWRISDGQIVLRFLLRAETRPKSVDFRQSAFELSVDFRGIERELQRSQIFTL